ncbi:MAG TPA: DoxX family protein [Terriglobales bacterium]|nr:DoxX family protein [Terriglobales bacterium]
MGDFCDRFRPLGLTLLRLALGVAFLSHGAMKLSALDQWQKNFVHMGFPGYVAFIIGPLEAVGGALLILGLFTRVAGLLLAGDLLVALVKVHLPAGPLWSVGRYELQMLLSAGAFLIFCYGAGPVALDAVFFGRSRGSGRGRSRG